MTTAAGQPPALAPGATIGILGGGQLGRMLALAAARLGFRCHIFCPDGERPAADVAAASTVAAYADEAALAAFAGQVDVITYEFENVPHPTAAFLDRLVPVRPSPRVLAITQDRWLEKSFLGDAGIATAHFAAVADEGELTRAFAGLGGGPAVLKTRRFGYDGKGQAFIADAGGLAPAWAAIGGAAAILEAFVAFEAELSVIIARGLDGATAAYDVVRNIHERHILARSIVPAGLDAALAGQARAIAAEIARRLDYVGILAVEMFLCPGGAPALLVNELAPRVHNSGHWTLDACTVSQFEQHIRAICGWPLGSARRHSDAVMENLLGEAVAGWPALSREPDTALHIYGKRIAAPGRKMGHITRLFPLGHGGGAGEEPPSG